MREAVFFNRTKSSIKRNYLDKGKTLENFTNDMLFAICCRMCQSGDYEISLKVEDRNSYAQKLDTLFNRCGIVSDYFWITPVLEIYDGIHDFFIDYIYAQNYGSLSSSYDNITLNINDYMATKTLKQNSDFSDFINEGYYIMTGQDHLSVLSTFIATGNSPNKVIRK